MTNDVLIVPDVHGRTFWKEPAEAFPGHIVFLGDYTDPYPSEHILPVEALLNMAEILQFAREHVGRTTLLLGNHDLHYISRDFRLIAQGSRYSYDHQDEYAALFRDNRFLFQLAQTWQYDGVKVLFSHAGVLKGWWKRHPSLLPSLDMARLNALLDSREGARALADVGRLRGGMQPYGSMVWADVDETDAAEPIEGIFQIFGHSKMDGPQHGAGYACLDCSKTFLLSEVLERVGERRG